MEDLILVRVHPEALGESSSEALSHASSSAHSVLEYEANLGDGFRPMCGRAGGGRAAMAQ